MNEHVDGFSDVEDGPSPAAIEHADDERYALERSALVDTLADFIERYGMSVALRALARAYELTR